LVRYDANDLQIELYEYELEACETGLSFLNKLKEIKHKLSLGGQAPLTAEMGFPMLNTLPKTTECKTWVIVMKPEFSTSVTNCD